MYRIDYADRGNAIEKLYKFMTNTKLTRPECAIWKGNSIPAPLTNNGNGFIPFEEFRRKLSHYELTAVTCTASTDRQDKERVVLTYAPELGYMVLNFPVSNGKINSIQRELIEELS